MIKVGINGFGRIGRLSFRAGLARDDIEFVGINDPFMTPDYVAYMLRYDTVHGQFKGSIEYDDNSVIVNGKKIPFFCEKNPADIPWGKVGADYIIDATGIFHEKIKAQAHIDAGAKKVIYSGPSKVRNGRQRKHLHQGYEFCFQCVVHNQLPCSSG